MKLPFKIIDLTHTLTPLIPTWNGSCGFQHELKQDYGKDENDPKFRVQQLKMHAGIGTHIDAPSHCIPGGKDVADLDLNDLIAPCVVIDVSKKANSDYLVTAADIDAFEDQYGLISPRTFVLINTGWEKYWDTPEKYRNNYQYPSVSKAAVLTLLKREIVGIGIDTLSPDRPGSGYPVHHLILGAGKYIVENVRNAALLPPSGAYSLALPIKTKEGAEAPIRLVGLIKLE